MKNYLIVLIILTIFISCGSEYDNIKQEIEELEQQAQALKKEKEKLEKDNKQTQEKIDSLLDKCYLKSMLFTMEDNPMQLTSDVRCEIIGDSIVECWIPNITNSKELIARFEYEGLELLIGDKQAISGITIINYNSPTILTINSKYKKMKYNIFVYSFTGLPIIWIENDSLAEASTYIEVIEKRQGLKVACLEDIAFRSGWITAEKLRELAAPMAKNPYGQYLLKLAEGAL